MIRKHFSVFLLLLYALLGLGFLSWSTDNVVRSLRFTAHYLLFPAVEPPLAAMERMGDFGRNLSRLISLDQTYRALEKRGLLVNMERLHCETVEAENRRLTALLGLTPIPRFETLTARVWARESSGGFHSISIRRGGRDGVRQADPVVVLENGRAMVLGQVAEVFPETSRILLLTDPSSAVSAQVPRTGEQGAVEGYKSSGLILNYLYSDTAVHPGDEVVTAGLGEVFPAGLLLGTVETVEANGSETFRRALVKPAARAGRVSEVLVLRKVVGPERKS